MESSEQTCDAKADVAILGAGIAGASLALILARTGVRVLLLDNGTHPRFALGESTLRPTSLWMKFLAARFSVPELDVISNVYDISRKIAPRSGIKKGFGFLYHQEKADVPQRWWLGNIPTGFADNAHESHMFRQDIDAYLYYAALKAGVVGISRTEVVNIDISTSAVTLETQSGARYQAAYVVDASGYQSALSKHFDLRQSQPNLKTKSRTLFTHMVGVHAYDECEATPTPALKWHSITLHHFTNGAWVWVIPFNNHPASANPLCSVGLTLDLNQYPERDGRPPEEEWAAFLARFPAIARQFENAVPVQPWVSTNRVQYLNTQCTGERYCLLSHAFGSVDALYSRGLLNTFQNINTVASQVLKALKDGDFSAHRFARVEEEQKNLLSIQDQLVSGTYRALGDADLLEAWLCIWSLSERLSIAHIEGPLKHYRATGNKETLTFNDENPGHCISAYPLFQSLLSRCHKDMESLEQGEIDKKETLSRIKTALQDWRALGFDYNLTRRTLGQANFTPLAAQYFKYEGLLVDLLARFSIDGHPLGQFSDAPLLVQHVAKWLARTADNPKDTSPLEVAGFTPKLPNLRLSADMCGEQLSKGLSKSSVPPTRLATLVSQVEKLSVRICESDSLDFMSNQEAGLIAKGWEIVIKSTNTDALHVYRHVVSNGVRGILIAWHKDDAVFVVSLAGHWE